MTSEPPPPWRPRPAGSGTAAYRAVILAALPVGLALVARQVLTLAVAALATVILALPLAAAADALVGLVLVVITALYVAISPGPWCAACSGSSRPTAAPGRGR